MSRDMNDPRVVEVIRVFHRHAGSGYSCAEHATQGYVSAVMADGYIQEDMFADWPAASLLPVLTAFVLNAPEDELDYSVAVARAFMASILDSEHSEAMETALDGAYSTGFDYPTVLKAEWERYQAEQQAAVQ
jgi:hypothetical protein